MNVITAKRVYDWNNNMNEKRKYVQENILRKDLK